MKKLRIALSAALLFGLDRLTKAWWGGADFGVIPGVLAFRGTRNTGMAFGWLPGGTAALAIVTALVIVGIVLFLRKKTPPRLLQYGAGLLLGGALGNLFDRVFLGYVIDFIDPVFAPLFVFNLADAGVTVGAALVALALLLKKEEKN
ncbi:MAG: signal peptidase II [Clostridia bacterium]|nr:signal peptidase II [Clostridia bacterium]